MNNRPSKKILSLALAFALALGMFTFAPMTAGAETEKNTLNVTAKTIAVGKSFSLKVKNITTGAEVAFSTTEEGKKVVSLTQEGIVKAEKIGNATITVNVTKDNKILATIECKVTVIQGAETVKITTNGGKNFTLNIGSEKQLTAAMTKKGHGDKVTWSSSDPKAASVSKSGKVTAKAVGTVTITAKTVSGKTATITIDVKANPTPTTRSSSRSSSKSSSTTIPVTGITVSPATLSLSKDDTQQLIAVVTPGNASNKAVTWVSDDTAIATVSSSGLVSAVDFGTTTITAKTVESGYTATCVVTVRPTFTYNVPPSIVENNVTARVTFDKPSPQPEGEPIKATVTLSGTPIAGNQYFHVEIKSTTLNRSETYDTFLQFNTPVNETFTFDFVMPNQNVDDITLLFTSSVAACFTGDTLITTKNGDRRIDEIEIGDLVWSWNEQSGEYGFNEVSALHRHENHRELLYIEAGGRTIKTTPNHRFYVEGVGFVRADKIVPGNYLLDGLGQKIAVTAAYAVQLDDPITVYNITVNDAHTYYAGGVLVHNVK